LNIAKLTTEDHFDEYYKNPLIQTHKNSCKIPAATLL